MTESRLIVDAAYVAWEAGDLPALLNCFSDDVAFAVHPRAQASFIGCGEGKALLGHRLDTFLSSYSVLDYSATITAVRDDRVECRVSYHYRHKGTGMEIDGRMRHLLQVAGDQIVRFDVIHDALRMGAFFQLAAHITMAVG